MYLYSNNIIDNYFALVFGFVLLLIYLCIYIYIQVALNVFFFLIPRIRGNYANVITLLWRFVLKNLELYVFRKYLSLLM